MKLFGIIGAEGAGKTALIARLVAELHSRGISVSTIKAADPAFDVDEPGKDSYRHRTAGATEVVLASRKRFALMHELRGEAPPDLPDLLGKLAPVDLVLIDGFAEAAHPKLEVCGVESSAAPVANSNQTVRAVAGGATLAPNLAAFAPEDTVSIADFILSEVGA